jgi:hypothetical protein
MRNHADVEIWCRPLRPWGPRRFSPDRRFGPTPAVANGRPGVSGIEPEELVEDDPCQSGGPKGSDRAETIRQFSDEGRASLGHRPHRTPHDSDLGARGQLGSQCPFAQQMPDPLDHRRGRPDTSLEPAQFEVRVGIDKTREDGHIAEVPGTGWRAARLEADDLPIVHGNPAAVDRRVIDWQDPASGEMLRT